MVEVRVLEDNINHVIKESRQKGISQEKIVSLYESTIEKLNDYLRYNKFGLEDGEIAVLRSGGLKETKFEGFNFVLESGETPYADILDEDVQRYVLQEKYILNLVDKNSELRKEFDNKLEILEKKTIDDRIVEIIRNVKKVIKEHDEENAIYTYTDIEENGLDFIVKELGFKGMSYWEWGDISTPSTYLVFDLSIVRETLKYYMLC